MRSTSSLAVKWMSVLTILVAIFALANLAFAQSASAKHVLSNHAQPVATIAKAKPAKSKAPPPATTDTWTGGGGSSNTNWSDAANWNNGAITSGENIAISLATANTVDDQSFTIGTLTLSNAGDSVTLNNNVQTTVEGNISNAGTITFNATGNTTGLYLNNSLALSGGGTINLTSTDGQYTGSIYGVADSTLTNSSNIVGGGNVGNAALNFANSGTINANISGVNLTVQPDICTGCASTNTGTLEATGGGNLVLYGGTWTQTGAGKITAANGSAVNLENSVSITGGTLNTSGSGVINDVNGNNVFLTNVTNSGAYVIQNNASTEISGTITNNGTLTMNATGNTTEIYLTGTATLAGSGTITMTSTDGQYTGQVNGVSGSVLTNQTTINGWGNVGEGNVQITNASNGTINSNIAGGNITVQPYGTGTSTNAGLIEATNGGAITMFGGTWTNSGTIEAQAGSAINLQNNVSITGGTLESVGTGSVNNVNSNNVFLTSLTLAGTYNVQNNAATEINGTITNNGIINLQGTGNTTELYVTSAASGSATLTGSGSIVLGTGAGNEFNGVSGTSLTIDQAVSGLGNIGAANLTLINNSTINANISPTVSAGSLTIQPGSGGMTNNGVLEATNGGTLTLQGSTITNTSGTIEAVGADSSSNPSSVVLTGGVGITGGTLTTSGAGVIDVATGQTVYLTSLTNKGTLNVINNAQIDTTGTITNNGTITLVATGNATYFYAPNTTTLTGTGTLVMSSTSGQYTGVVEAGSGATLTNDETITGAGTIQGGTFVNNGTINANVNGQSITLQSMSAATNTKTMEASNGGTLIFTAGNNWTNTGGTITAEAGSAIDLTDTVSITGGTLSSVGTGQVYVATGNTAYVSGLTLAGTVNVENNGQLDTTGTITNNGTLTLQASGNSTYFYAPNATTLTGTGTLVLSSTSGQYTGIVDVGATLTNDETIAGAGTIDGGGALTNNGVINANVSGQSLTLESFSSATNTKTLEASNGGQLIFTAGSTWTQTGAGAIAAQTGSSVELTDSASITGGTLTTVGTGQFYAASGNTVYLTNLTNNGTFNIQNDAQTELTGTITNNGSFNELATGNQTYLLINGAVTLKGTGIINLTSTSGQYTGNIFGEGSNPILTSFNTIEGEGNLGSGNMGFTNDGIVDANVAGGTLAINVGTEGFTNYNGTTTTLTGGTYIANGGNITFNAGNTTGITTLSASVTEEGGGQILNVFNNGSTNALASLNSITSTGSFTTDVNFTDPGAFSNAGVLDILGSTTFKVGSLAQISSGSLTAGTYVLNSNLDITGAAQTITTNAATLTLAGGTIQNTANSTNALAGLANNTGKLTIGGNTAFTTTAASFNNTGTLTVGAGSTFSAPALTQISGSTLTGGTFVLGGNIDLTATANITTNASTLTLEGGTIKTGSTNDLANLAANTKSLTLANNANFTTVGAFSNTGSLTVNSGSTFTSTGALSQYKTTTNALQGGIFVVGGTLAFGAGANGIETDASNLTMEGTGTIENTTTGAASTNALANFNTIASTGSFTLADDANFTTAANFTNSGKLTIDPGSTFSVTGTLTNLSSGTLTGGTYTVDGTLQLASANGGITTNAANLTLAGTTAKILDGTSNALSGFDNNTGSLTLASAITLVTANSTFTNSGTVDVEKGTIFETGTGAAKEYSQTAGTTTVDGILAGGGTTGISVTGGTVLGAGTLHGNTSNSATISAGDAGKAGLLTITGTYTQLSSGTLNVNVGGTTVGTLYSQVKISGKASLGGTLAVTLINSFTPSIGQTFTVLTAAGGFGGTTFTNTTIAINSSEQFDISYSSTGVVLTVVATTPSNSNKNAQPAEMAAADPKQAVGTSTLAKNVGRITSKNNLRHAVGTGFRKNVEVADIDGGKLILPGAAAASAPRIWEHVAATPSWDHVKAVTVAQTPRAVALGGMHSGLAQHVNNWTGASHAVPVQMPLAGWTGVNNSHRVPMHLLPTTLPAVR